MSLGLLAGCGAPADQGAEQGTHEDGSGSAATASASGTASATQAGAVSVTDAWVKAADAGAMTSAFATVTNTGPAEVHLVGAATLASPMVELHETVLTDAGTSTMREKAGGFTLAPGATLILAPGGDHIMLMNLSEALLAGDDVTLTLEFADGSTLDVTAPIKDYAGAQESYDPAATDDASMDM